MAFEDSEEELIKKKILESILKQKESPQGAVISLTAETFYEFINSHENVVVDCWAEWCYPCRVVSPIVEELARKYAGKISFAKLNVDENPEIASDFGIMGIPTLLVFKNGQLADAIVGALPKKLLEQRILEALGGVN